MIKVSKSYQTEDGQLFATENAARLHELDRALLSAGADPELVKATISTLDAFLELAVENLTGSVRVRGKYNRKAKATPAEPKAK